MAGFSNPDSYEQWMGRWSRRLAPEFLNFADLSEGGRFLDVGSGTGVLSAALIESMRAGSVIGLEPSETYVAYCRARFHDDRASFEQGDATAIPFEDGEFDATLSFLVLQEIPDARAALREMRRVTRAGGFVAASQWDFQDGLPMLAHFWEAAIEILDDPAVRETAAEVMCVDYPDEAALRRLWEESNLTDVHIRPLNMQMRFQSFEDYWTPFLSGVTATSSVAARLGSEDRLALRMHLNEKIYGKESDGAFVLPSRAWAIRGTAARD